jgi:uncharacterized protein
MAYITTTGMPVTPSERILSLDVLRGFAVLGILIMNIQSFSMPGAAYINPTAYGGLAGLDRWVAILSHVFADLKFMTIFSILYGAGIVMVTQRAEARGASPARVHYLRNFWLIFIGMLHAYLLWYGDILVKYGICALLAYVFRKARPKRLLVAGLIIFSVGFLLLLLFGWSIRYWPEESLQRTLSFWQPDAGTVAEEVSAYQGGWLEQMANRIPTAIMSQTFIFFTRTVWRIFGLMLVGMALFKWGVLTARRSRRFYLTVATVGFGIGFPVVVLGAMRNYAAGWPMDYSLFQGQIPNYCASLLVSLGYISTVMLISQAGNLRSIVRPLAAVGRMAFTNYLAQTLVCTAIFYGHGLGLFGRVERTEQILIVFGVWAVQLIRSTIWLHYLRFGPFEWLWRTLTYLRVQPIRNRS